MRLLGNLLWLVLAGWWLAISYVVAGVLACLTVVGIPFGIASFRLAGLVVWPFGRTAVFKRDAGVFSFIGNVLWVLLLGWELALAHLFAGLLLCLTVVGIPLGLACCKMVPLALFPLGREIVPVRSADDAFVRPLGH